MIDGVMFMGVNHGGGGGGVEGIYPPIFEVDQLILVPLTLAV